MHIYTPLVYENNSHVSCLRCVLGSSLLSCMIVLQSLLFHCCLPFFVSSLFIYKSEGTAYDLFLFKNQLLFLEQPCEEILMILILILLDRFLLTRKQGY